MESKHSTVIIKKDENDSSSISNDCKQDQVSVSNPNEPNSSDISQNNPQKYGRIVILLENPILSNEIIQQTPSMNDGLEPEIENDLRISGCKLIQISGILLRLPQVAMATGQVLFQRFYYSKSFVRQPMEITAMACVVLASKVEEAPRRMRDVINVFHNMMQIRLGQSQTPMILDENYVFLKNQVIKAERRILKELGFCVHVKHPHKFIVAVAQTLTKESNLELIQAAWSYMNDSLQTNVCVRFPPEAIACACIHLSSRILKVPLPTQPTWYELFNVNNQIIETICKEILMLYTRKTLSQEELEAKVDEARIRLDAEKLKARQKQAISQNLENVNSPIMVDSPSNSCESIPKNVELKSTIGKSIQEMVVEKLDENSKKTESRQDQSDHSSVESSSSFKLQKSPIKTEDKSSKKKIDVTEENHRLSNHYKTSHKNGHSATTSSDNQDFYYYTNDSREKTRRDAGRDFEKDQQSKHSPPRSYISSTIVTKSEKRNDDGTNRYKNSRSRSPISPYDDHRPQKYRRSGEHHRSQHLSNHDRVAYDNRRNEKDRSRNRSHHDSYQKSSNRSPSRSPNSYSSSKYHRRNYHKSSGRY